MIFFALSLQLCVSSIGCHWLEVEQFVTEAECLQAGKLYTVDSDGDIFGNIVDYKCVVKVRQNNPRQNIG